MTGRLARLGDLIAGCAPDLAGIEVTGLSADSRRIGPGMLFAALPGSRFDGVRFAPDAVRRGASAILLGDQDLPAGDLAVPILRAGDPRRAFALAAAAFYDRQPETIVAVTGTSGKTSVAEFTRQIFTAAGKQAASLGTLGITTDRGTDYGSLTTPDPVSLHQTLASIADDGITHLAMEASSHGIDQRRLDGVRLKAAAFTNLGRDHLDYHPTMEDYFAAKMRLFDTLLPRDGIGVVDVDSPWGERAVDVLDRRGIEMMTVGVTGSTLRLSDILIDKRGQRLILRHGCVDHRVFVPLHGTFQVNNAVVAAALAIASGMDPATAIGALEGLKGAAGRLERVGETSDGAPVFVDYAHKPDALESVLKALRPLTEGRLIVVFGAGGDRDPGKRKLMGAAADALADEVIVTDDNPRTENPASIRAAILSAVPRADDIGDRAEAIHEGIRRLRTGDVLVIAGKGHEPGQIVGTETLPFSDRDVARAALGLLEG